MRTQAMRRIGAALFLLVIGAAPAFTAELPNRKAGLWEITTDAGNQAMKIQQCIDAATDHAMQARGGAAPQGDCSKRDVQKSGNTTTIELGLHIRRQDQDLAYRHHRQLRQRIHDDGDRPDRGAARRAHRHVERQMARPLRGGSAARRHDHAERHEDEHPEYAKHAKRHDAAGRRRRAAWALMTRSVYRREYQTHKASTRG